MGRNSEGFHGATCSQITSEYECVDNDNASAYTHTQAHIHYTLHVDICQSQVSNESNEPMAHCTQYWDIWWVDYFAFKCM